MAENEIPVGHAAPYNHTGVVCHHSNEAAPTPEMTGNWRRVIEDGAGIVDGYSGNKIYHPIPPLLIETQGVCHVIK